MVAGETLFAQKHDSTRYPYGGEAFDTTDFDGDSVKALRFRKPLIFKREIFQNNANFGSAHFARTADFSGAHFDSIADFSGAEFARADFSNAQFDSAAYFFSARFYNAADFYDAQFDSTAYFSSARFDSAASFFGAQFARTAIFRHAEFVSITDFRDAVFQTSDFSDASIKGIFQVGGRDSVQKFDFYNTVFSPDAKLEIWDRVKLEMQVEKIRHIALAEKLPYNAKSKIISYLKEASFKDNREAQSQLEYLLSTSTMDQAEGDEYLPNSWWAKLGNKIFDWTMGFGYHPFRLVWWALGVVAVFAVKFWRGLAMSKSINEYITTNFKSSRVIESAWEDGSALSLHTWESLLNCIYFSAMVFFTLRLKGSILTSFSSKEKAWIVIEWVIGFLVYAAFIVFSKAGILQTLKDLFFG